MWIQNNLFDIYWENPLKTYMKIKRFFLPLKPKIRCNFQYYKNCAKILEFSSFDVLWKDKYDTPRHEISPRISISLFSCIHIMINFIADRDSMSDMVYWEAALYWLYYDKTLNEAIQESTGWSTLNKETGKYEEIPFVILKEPWQTMYLSKQLNFKYGDTSR